MSPRIKHFLLLSLLLLLALPPRLWAQASHQAALVIRYGDGQVETRCVAFTEPQITGYDVLVRAGLDVTIDAGGMGAAVCAIQGIGCPANDCFCHCQGDACQYWSYWHQVGGAWEYSLGGASIYPVTDGAIEGWSWGPGSVTAATAPPVVSFDAVCNAPAVTATPVPPTPTWPAPQVNFWVEAATVNAGICTVLHWQVDYATAVYLDGAGVEGVGARQVCPAQTQTYTLRVVHAGGELQRQVSVTVQPPSTATPAAATATLAPPPTNQPTRTSPAPTTTPIEATAVMLANPTATEDLFAVAFPTVQTFTAIPSPPAALPTAAIAFVIPAATVTVETPAAMSAAAAPALTPVPLPTALPADAAAAAAAGSWLNYAAFALVCLGLGGALALQRKRRAR